MSTYKIRGVNVDFPFEAYDCQIVYMEKVIQALQEGSNALLESPTGTGKTLCLLCATLAWRKSLLVSRKYNEDEVTDSQQASRPKIIYTSRTHSQLKQVIRELKISKYRPKMTVLGSRQQLCIHKDVGLLQGRARDKACHSLCKKRSCSHYVRVSEFTKRDSFGNEPFDIEDLASYGRINGPCPYYVSRELHRKADIIFAPYNYLIDPKRRGSLTGVSWDGTVLIFDEAHNLEGICSDAASFDLPSSFITACISEAKQCIDLSTKKRSFESSAEKQSDPEQYAILRALLLKLEKHINEVVIDTKELGFTRPGPYIYTFLSDMNIKIETANMLIHTIDEAVLLLEEAESANVPQKSGAIWRLEGFRDILEIIFRNGETYHAKFYQFHVQESQQKFPDARQGKGSRTLSWWCFNPGIAMEEFTKLGISSIILTSGTLSPMDSFAVELNLKFPIRLENPHVISPNQVWAGVVPTGPSGGMLNSSFKYRDSLQYKQELGNSIVNFARIVPDGLLVFFSSYYLMDQCIACWKEMGNAKEQKTIWERICKNKQPVIEPKQSALFADAIEDYEFKLGGTSTTGAILFAVFRGKVSEGLDFADQAGRAVIITGMPFATLVDPKVRLKRDYLDRQTLTQNKDGNALTGEEWYLQQAVRAVNQAVGRVIRHRHDYGAIIYCDERFSHLNNQNHMSYWIRPHVKCYSSFGGAVSTLARFFRDNSACVVERLKQDESLNTGNLSEVNIQNKDKKPVSEVISHLVTATNHEYSKKQLAFNLSEAIGSSSTYKNLDEIVPANRSNVSNILTPLVHQKNYGNLLPLPKRSHAFDEKHKTSQHNQECEVVDLTGDESLKFSNEFGNFIGPHLRKKSKLPKTSNALHAENNASSGHSSGPVCRSSSMDPLANAFVSDSGKQLTQFSKSKMTEAVACHRSETKDPLTKPETVDNSVQTSLGASLELQAQPLSHCSRPISSSKEYEKVHAFLAEVQEKVADADYKEFMDLMRALKYKRTRILPVLESIIKLLSIPERFSLLRSFREFVPVEFRPWYEKHLKAFEVINGSDGKVDTMMSIERHGHGSQS